MSPDPHSGATAASSLEPGASSPEPGASSPEPGASVTAPSHDFDVQKQVHRRIRNDPDYDDWEYGTEPLPQESWVQRSDAEAADG